LFSVILVFLFVVRVEIKLLGCIDFFTNVFFGPYLALIIVHVIINNSTYVFESVENVLVGVTNVMVSW